MAKKLLFQTLISFFLFALTSSVVWADKFAEASKAYHEGDYSQAKKMWLQLANDGHQQSQFNIAYMYEFGIEVKPDYSKAVKWYRKAAGNGYARAQNFLGWMYEIGKGVTRDRATALKWLKLAADQGSKDAIADHRLVSKRLERSLTREYKHALYEALKTEFIRSQERYDKSKLPDHLDAAKDIP
ncbi:MAG: sel1 repeat family protein [Gammaproteobacteria bacterium]|nr:sel1 repeat family protein [Gammaproteobacteria bacterium]